MLTIARIVDNDSQGTKVQLSDGSFGIIVHGQAAPSVGQEVEPSAFGYLVAVEGTRPHQTVDMSGVDLDEYLNHSQGEANAVEPSGRATENEDSDNAQTQENVG